jgi:hypothetical protein
VRRRSLAAFAAIAVVAAAAVAVVLVRGRGDAPSLGDAPARAGGPSRDLAASPPGGESSPVRPARAPRAPAAVAELDHEPPPLPPEGYEPAPRPPRPQRTAEEERAMRVEGLRLLDDRLASLGAELDAAEAAGDADRAAVLRVRRARMEETRRIRQAELDAR